MKTKLMLKTAILSSLFSILVLVVVFLAMENRILLAGNRFSAFITAVDEEEAVSPDENAIDIIMPVASAPVADEINQEHDSLVFELGSADTNYLIIPVPAGTEKKDVTIENHYLNDEMRIIIEGVANDFYATNSISGNRKNIISGSYENAGDHIILKLNLNNIYEYYSIMEGDKIYVEFVPPREMHDKIIVIDPAYGGSERGIVANNLAEKDVVLAIALKLKELLDTTDYKVYYTRTADNDVNEEKRVRVANNTRAYMLIRIECDSNEDSLVNGTTTIYSSYFIPHFGSPDLADILEKEVVSNIRGKAIGLHLATADDYVIMNATVPAAAIKVGHLTNAQEASLLGRDDYLDKIAQGIFNAIRTVFDD